MISDGNCHTLGVQKAKFSKQIKLPYKGESKKLIRALKVKLNSKTQILNNSSEGTNHLIKLKTWFKQGTKIIVG